MKCCEEYAALLDPFVDGELTPEEMERVREHLEDCPGCPLPLVRGDGDAGTHMAAFRIQILFREHYTWQGRLIWQDEDIETVFYSSIELMQLIDEILGE